MFHHSNNAIYTMAMPINDFDNDEVDNDDDDEMTMTTNDDHR